MSLPVLGVDPGATSGACVLVDSAGRRVLWWLAYWRRTQGYAVASAFTDDVGAYRDVPRVGQRAAWELTAPLQGQEGEQFGYGYLLCVESLFAGRKASPESILRLGQACGELIGPIAGSPRCVSWLPRPRAREDWRPAVLGLHRAGADAAEEAAVKLAPRVVEWPGGWPRLSSAAGQGALAEAACIARWGATVGTMSLAPLTSTISSPEDVERLLGDGHISAKAAADLLAALEGGA